MEDKGEIYVSLICIKTRERVRGEEMSELLRIRFGWFAKFWGKKVEFRPNLFSPNPKFTNSPKNQCIKLPKRPVCPINPSLHHTGWATASFNNPKKFRVSCKPIYSQNSGAKLCPYCFDLFNSYREDSRWLHFHGLLCSL